MLLEYLAKYYENDKYNVHRGFPKDFQPTNLGRDNLSREIGRNPLKMHRDGDILLRLLQPSGKRSRILASRFDDAATMCECVHIMSDRNVKCLTGSDCS